MEDKRNTLDNILGLSQFGVNINVVNMVDGRVTGFFINGADTQYVTCDGRSGCGLSDRERDGRYRLHTVGGSRYCWLGEYTLEQLEELIKQNLSKSTTQINEEFRNIANIIFVKVDK